MLAPKRFVFNHGTLVLALRSTFHNIHVMCTMEPAYPSHMDLISLFSPNKQHLIRGNRRKHKRNNFVPFSSYNGTQDSEVPSGGHNFFTTLVPPVVVLVPTLNNRPVPYA
mmetsp:Transcript_46672/g.68998  ORF Transcript_46672/g.68998 Transcript_46672/m.68998 type:complete len:110 (-) Transcript_46672:1060-1389(-)